MKETDVLLNIDIGELSDAERKRLTPTTNKIRALTRPNQGLSKVHVHKLVLECKSYVADTESGKTQGQYLATGAIKDQKRGSEHNLPPANTQEMISFRHDMAKSGLIESVVKLEEKSGGVWFKLFSLEMLGKAENAVKRANFVNALALVGMPLSDYSVARKAVVSVEDLAEREKKSTTP